MITDPQRQIADRDVFISHASEDKGSIARPLAEQLRTLKVSVWFDEYELMLGDSLRETIGDGLRHSRVGVVILSPRFFEKRWPQWELDGLTARRIAGEPNVILPVWHDVDLDDVRSYSAPLADVVAAKSSDGVEAIANGIVRVLDRLAAGDSPLRALAAGQLTIGGLEVIDNQPKRSLTSLLTSVPAIVVTIAVLAVAVSVYLAIEDPQGSGGSPQGSGRSAAPAAPDAKDILRNDGELSAAGEGFLVSANGRYRLTMQRNSNLVLSGPNGRVLWHTDTAGHGAAKARMQRDGNLVILDPAGNSLWDSRTSGHARSFLRVENDGRLVIYSEGRAIWVNGKRR